jgi:hypothetical protein
MLAQLALYDPVRFETLLSFLFYVQ